VILTLGVHSTTNPHTVAPHVGALLTRTTRYSDTDHPNPTAPISIMQAVLNVNELKRRFISRMVSTFVSRLMAGFSNASVHACDHLPIKIWRRDDHPCNGELAHIVLEECSSFGLLQCQVQCSVFSQVQDWEERDCGFLGKSVNVDCGDEQGAA
jgi:hypothetical protein